MTHGSALETSTVRGCNLSIEIVGSKTEELHLTEEWHFADAKYPHLFGDWQGLKVPLSSREVVQVV